MHCIVSVDEVLTHLHLSHGMTVTCTSECWTECWSGLCVGLALFFSKMTREQEASGRRRLDPTLRTLWSWKKQPCLRVMQHQA